MAQASMTGVILNVENLKSKLDKLSVSIMSISIKYYASLCYIAISSCFYRAKIDRQEFISIDQSYFLLTWRVVNWWLTSRRVIRSKWLLAVELDVDVFVRYEVVVLTPPTRFELYVLMFRRWLLERGVFCDFFLLSEAMLWYGLPLLPCDSIFIINDKNLFSTFFLPVLLLKIIIYLYL